MYQNRFLESRLMLKVIKDVCGEFSLSLFCCDFPKFPKNEFKAFEILPSSKRWREWIYKFSDFISTRFLLHERTLR